MIQKCNRLTVEGRGVVPMHLVGLGLGERLRERAARHERGPRSSADMSDLPGAFVRHQGEGAVCPPGINRGFRASG